MSWTSIAGLIGLVAAAAASAADQAPEAETAGLEVVRCEVDRATNDERALDVTMYVANASDGMLTVLTRNLDARHFAYTPQSSVVNVYIDETESIDGRPVVPSYLSFAPVLLAPGEITDIRVRCPQGGNEEAVSVTYDMAGRWADRFQCWIGRLHAGPVDVGSAWTADRASLAKP